MRTMNAFFAILWKDLVSEWRSPQRVFAMFIFAWLTVLVLRFAQPGGAMGDVSQNAPGLLWITYLFAAVLGLTRSFQVELENQCFTGLALASVERGWIFLGKAVANAIFLWWLQLTTFLVFALLFNLSWFHAAGTLIGIFTLGALAIAGIGSLVAALAIRSPFRDALLPILLLPLLIPVLLAAVRATTAALNQEVLSRGPLELLVVSCAVYWIVGWLAFEYVLDD